MTEETKNCEIDVAKLQCPFCGYTEVMETRIEIRNQQAVSVFGIDYWECPTCGEENDIGLECFEQEFAPFKQFTEICDWNGLATYCANNFYDDFMLYSLARYYVQKQDFDKSLHITQLLIEFDPGDICARELFEKCNRKQEQIKRNAKVKHYGKHADNAL